MAALAEWTPKSILALKDYNPKTFFADLLAGVTVGLVALPLAMAFAISSGLKPENGLYCAIVAGGLSALLSGSKTQISGPTGAFVVVVAGIVATHGVTGLFHVTLIAGVLLFLLGVTGLGSAVKFIPRPVVIGFTNGIAVLIASTQIKDFFGIKLDAVPGDFLDRMIALARASGTINPEAVLVSSVGLGVLILFRKFIPRVPGAIVVLFLGTLICWLLKLPIESIQTKFGGIPQGLPKLQLPKLEPARLPVLIGPALTVTMLGAIESLMSAVVADRMTKDKHNPNVELVAQGIANIFSPLFGGLPSTGAIARTATNIRAGAKTPWSGVIHALVLLIIISVAAPLASPIPLAILAAILMMTAYNMGEWHEIKNIFRMTRADIAVWAITFFLTVFADLTVAVQAGMMLAALLYISKVTRTTSVAKVDEEYLHQGVHHMLHAEDIPEGVAVFRIHGPFLFGATDKISAIEDQIDELPHVIVLRLRNMTAIDGTGVQALEELHTLLRESGRSVIFCGVRPQPEATMRKYGVTDWLGEENFCDNVRDALGRAAQIVELNATKTP